MLTTAFAPIDIVRLCTDWSEQSWVNGSETVSRAFGQFLFKAHQVNSWDHGYYIHIYHTFDNEGNRHSFRRIDYVHALYKFMMRLGTTNIWELTNDYNVLISTLRVLEPLWAPARMDPTPVQCIILDGPVYMNGHM